MRYDRGVTTLNPWPRGVNNLTSDRGLPAGDDGAVRNAVNVDFAGPEELYSRKGMTKVYSAINARFGLNCPLGEYIVEGSTLKKFNTDNTATPLLTGVYGTTCTFDYFNEVLYFSDGLRSHKITDSQVVQWGVTPPPAPTLSSTSGVYGEGVYLGCCAWVDANGVESGASPTDSISVGSNSGIVFTNLPTATDPQVVSLRLYLSTANGKELYHVADTTSSSYTVAAGRYDEGATAEHLFVSPAPAGRIIRLYGGRAYVADQYGTVWYSDPFEFDHFRPGTNFLQFPSPVDIMEPVANGIFFAYGNQTDFYAGTPEDGFDISSRFNYGGVYGTGRKVPKSDPVTVTWQSQRGTVVGSSDGQCKNMQEANVAVESAVSGASLIREQNGLRQWLVSLKQPTTSTLAARSWLDAEVIRRGA